MRPNWIATHLVQLVTLLGRAIRAGDSEDAQAIRRVINGLLDDLRRCKALTADGVLIWKERL